MAGLSAAKVRNPGKPGRYADGKGLYLLVRPKRDDPNVPGAKSWVLRVQVNGKRTDYGLGSVDVLSLADARDKAIEGRRVAKLGGNPALEWRRALDVIPTFQAAAERLHENLKAGWKNGKHQDQWLNTLKTYAFPMIGETPVCDVDVPAVQKVLLPIWLEKPETARRVRQRVGAVLDYASGHPAWRTLPPSMKAINKGLPRQPRADGHHAAMPYADAPAFMAKLRSMTQTVGRRALQLAVLTAARSGEVRGATWSEFDLEAATWTIPAARMKAREAHTVPLSPVALALVEELRGLFTHRPDEVVFPGLGRKPLSDMTLAKALSSAGGDAYTVHGFRSTFRDWVAEKMPTVPGDVAEAALAHTVANKTEAAYRRAKYLEQRTDLMARWSDYLAGASNVVRLVANG